MRLFSLERIEEILEILREIFELDLLYNLDLHRLEIYTGISQQVVRKPERLLNLRLEKFAKIKVFLEINGIKTHKSIPNQPNFTANNRIWQQAMNAKTRKSSCNFKSA